ncbi:MAG: cytochrome c [Chloroflexi bacterium]|nr:cytochrome c [Chloroflexota bacterium]
MNPSRFVDLCARCHGLSGEGVDERPSLLNSEDVQSSDDESILTLIARGNSKTGMPDFRRKLGEEEMRGLIELLRSWQ